MGGAQCDDYRVFDGRKGSVAPAVGGGEESQCARGVIFLFPFFLAPLLSLLFCCRWSCCFTFTLLYFS